MNRLTSEDGQLYACGYGRCNDEINCTCGDCHYTEEAFKKLAAYEDTGLQPEHIDSIIEQLLGYLDAEQAGLLIELPCKVGDTVYVYNLDVCDWVMSPKVLTFVLCQSGWFVTLDMGSTDKHPDGEAWCMKLSDFGKTIFLTREEAEKALKE